MSMLIRLTRIVVFVTTSISAITVFGILVSIYNPDPDDGNIGSNEGNLQGIGFITCILTLLVIPVMTTCYGCRCPGSSGSSVKIELFWTWFLWIFWFALGVTYTCNLGFICNNLDLSLSVFNQNFGVNCDQLAQAIVALGNITWIMLLFYCSLLSTLAVMQHRLGNTGIWSDLVTETDFMYVGAKRRDTAGTQTPIVPEQIIVGSYTQAGVP